jgi:hypothetical protein
MAATRAVVTPAAQLAAALHLLVVKIQGPILLPAKDGWMWIRKANKKSQFLPAPVDAHIHGIKPMLPK